MSTFEEFQEMRRIRKDQNSSEATGIGKRHKARQEEGEVEKKENAEGSKAKGQIDFLAVQ